MFPQGMPNIFDMPGFQQQMQSALSHIKNAGGLEIEWVTEEIPKELDKIKLFSDKLNKVQAGFLTTMMETEKSIIVLYCKRKAAL